MVVSNSDLVRRRVPKHFYKEPFTDLTILSHMPPHQGESGMINRQSGDRGPNLFLNESETDLKVWALSLYITEGVPLLEMNL